MAAGIYSANGDMQVMNSNAHQYSLQHPHHAQQQRGAPQSTAAAQGSYAMTTSAPPQLSNNGPAHYHHGQQITQPNGGYNNNNNAVVNGTDRSRTRGGEEDEQHHRRRRSRSNNRRNTSTTITNADRRHHNGNGGESCPLSDSTNPQGAGAAVGGASHQFHYPAGVGVSNNVTPPSQDTTSGSAHALANNNSSTNNNSAQAALDAAQRRPSYLLHRDLVIGKGSYGQVCIASRGEAEGHHSTSRSGKRKKFACKCVMLRNDPKYIAKLQEEVNVLRELRGHDNVIRLFDVFCVDNELFIITELGRGGDLFHLLTTHPKHGVTEAYAGEFLCVCLRNNE